MYPTTGYFQPVNKICTRCHRPVECVLYTLCETCQAIDQMIADAPTPDVAGALAAGREMEAEIQDDLDRELEIQNARNVF